MTRARVSSPPSRRLLAACAFLLAAGLAAGVSHANDGVSKDFGDANVRWTLPDASYTWMELGADDKESGAFARAISQDRSVQAFGLTGPSAEFNASDRVEEMSRSLRAYAAGGVTATKFIDTVLAGHDAKAVLLAGTDRNDSAVQIRAYVVEVNDTFYQLILLLFHGVEKERSDELNALRDGYQLLRGGGTKQTVETFSEIGGEEAGSGKATTKDDGVTDGEPWPEKGPPRDGNKVTFTGYNLEWTLPADSPLSWRAPIRDLANVFKRDGNTTFMSAAIRVIGRIERVKGEFDPEDAPTHNELDGMLFMRELEGQFDPDRKLRSPEFERELQRDHGFTSFNSSKSRQSNIPIGNHKGVMAIREGPRQDGKTSTIVVIETTLRGWAYAWRFLLTGFEADRLRQFQPHISALLAGVHFPENQEFVPGPLVPTDGLATFSGKRGKFKDEEKKYEINGFSWGAPSNRSAGGYTTTDGWVFKKPPGLAELHVGERGLQLALEGRTEDGQAYIYYSVWAEASARLQNEKREDVMIIDEHAKSWLSSLGETAKASKSGKPPFFRAGAYEGAKGLKYEFTATVDDVPYVEEGYVVTHKQTTYWVRIQMGGANAEKLLKNELRAIKKGFSWVR